MLSQLKYFHVHWHANREHSTTIEDQGNYVSVGEAIFVFLGIYAKKQRVLACSEVCRTYTEVSLIY